MSATVQKLLLRIIAVCLFLTLVLHDPSIASDLPAEEQPLSRRTELSRLLEDARRHQPSDFLFDQVVSAQAQGVPVCAPFQSETSFRGFAGPEFTPRVIVEYVFGRSPSGVRSWLFSRLLEEFKERGMNPVEAVREVAENIADRIRQDIMNFGVQGYARRQAGLTSLNREKPDTSATSLCVEPEMYYCVPYAKKHATPDSPAIVLEFDSRAWWIIPNKAYSAQWPYEQVALSHIPARSVKSVFLGFKVAQPPSDDSRQSPGRPGLRWYAVTISRRYPTGAPAEVCLSHALEHRTFSSGEPRLGLSVESEPVLRINEESAPGGSRELSNSDPNLVVLAGEILKCFRLNRGRDHHPPFLE